MKPELTEREQKIFNYMLKEVSEKGYPPTVREMCSSLGIKSTSTAHKDIDNLTKKGYIRKDPSKPRAIELLVDTDNSKAAKNDYIAEKKTTVIDIPLVGQIAAGNPISAIETVEDFFPVPENFIGAGNHFMLTVKGDSMIEIGIFDGDYILVLEQNTAKNGDVVVALVEDFEAEATVKTFYKEADYIRLQPENSTMSPILVKDVKILGLVKGVFRKFQ